MIGLASHAVTRYSMGMTKKAKPAASHASTIQITFRIPEEWLEWADELASKHSAPGLVLTRTDGFRTAMAAGFEKYGKKSATR